MSKSSKSKSRSRVSSTAYFTAAVWNELGVPYAGQFVTGRGRWLNRMVRWGGSTIGLGGQYSVTNLFLANRHLGLNQLLADLGPTQVIELAAGLSPRGLSWLQHYPDSRYLEIDQPQVIAAKHELLGKRRKTEDGNLRFSIFDFRLGINKLSPQSSVLSPEFPPTPILLSADLLGDEGAELGMRLTEYLDPGLPTVIIAEGITGYLDEMTVRRLLAVIHNIASHFEQATILIDFYLRLERKKHGRVALAMSPAIFFSKLVGAPMQMFLSDEADIRALVESSGFGLDQLYDGSTLAKLAGRPIPPVNLFYIAQIRKFIR